MSHIFTVDYLSLFNPYHLGKGLGFIYNLNSCRDLQILLTQESDIKINKTTKIKPIPFFQHDYKMA